MTTTEFPIVVCQEWEESERGWGQRPDGYSYHKSDADRKAYIKAYWDSMPDAVPDEYSRPSSGPFLGFVSKELYNKVHAQDEGTGIRDYTRFTHPKRVDEHIKGS